MTDAEAEAIASQMTPVQLRRRYEVLRAKLFNDGSKRPYLAQFWLFQDPICWHAGSYGLEDDSLVALLRRWWDELTYDQKAEVMEENDHINSANKNGLLEEFVTAEEYDELVSYWLARGF